MNTYSVPIYLGVRAKNKKEAVELAKSFMEYAVEVGNDEETYPYCDVLTGKKDVIKQKGES